MKNIMMFRKINFEAIKLLQKPNLNKKLFQKANLNKKNKKLKIRNQKIIKNHFIKKQFNSKLICCKKCLKSEKKTKQNKSKRSLSVFIYASNFD